MAGNISYVRRRSSSVCCDTTLPWDKFHYWIHCICVVTFDLEIGQTLEFIVPKGVKLTEKEKTNICYLSFPDSNSGCAGDTIFHFRIRSDNQNSYDSKHTEFIKSFNRCSPSSLLLKVGNTGLSSPTCLPLLALLHELTSFVILTKLPFVNLFYQLVEKIAVEFFRFSLPSLETACNEIDHWPLPTPGSSLNLPLMGAIIQVYLPSRHENSTYILTRMNLPCETLATSTCFIASAYEPNFYEYLSPVLSHLHLLWEVVLLGEPLAVMALSPSICSNVVHSLVTLIFPLRPHPDYRPFFTIHDSEFREFTSKANKPPSIVVGVTNPFFTKTLEHWPNVLRIVDSVEVSPIKWLYTKYKPFLTKDKTLLKKILKAAPCVAPFKDDDFFCMLENSGSHFTSSIKGDWIGLYKKFFAGPIFKLWLEQRQQEIDEKLQMLHLEVLCAAPLYSSIMMEKREIELIDIVLKLRDKLKFVDDNKDRVSQQTRSRLVEHYQVFLDALPDDMKSVLQSNSNHKLLPKHSSVSNRSSSASPPFHS